MIIRRPPYWLESQSSRVASPPPEALANMQNKKPAVTPNQANTGKQKDISMATSAPLDFPNASSLAPRTGG